MRYWVSAMARGRKSARKIAAVTTAALGFCVIAAASSPAWADDVSTGAALTPAVSQSIARPKRADFHAQIVPEAVRHAADWVTDSGDNRGLPFVIVDKPEAKVFVFDKDGEMVGTASVLVGLARGDDSLPGIGNMALSAIDPDMRTTPAGRFVSALGHDLGKLDVLWVDYPDAISLHRVINTNPAERRLERIVSPEPREHRISYGCINVPAKFFDTVVDPIFKGSAGIVYILPEVKSMEEVFPTYYNVDEKYPRRTVGLPVSASR